MNLSKAYDCLPRNLLIAKLEAYGLDRTSLRLSIDYLNPGKLKQKLVHPTEIGLKFDLKFRKVPCWSPCYSI